MMASITIFVTIMFFLCPSSFWNCIAVYAVKYHIYIGFKHLFNKGVPILRHAVDRLEKIDHDPDIKIWTDALYIRKIPDSLLLIMGFLKHSRLRHMRFQPHPVIQSKLHQNIVLCPERIPKQPDHLLWCNLTSRIQSCQQLFLQFLTLRIDQCLHISFLRIKKNGKRCRLRCPPVPQ